MDKKRFDEIIRSNLVKKEGCGSFIKGKPYYTLPAFNMFVGEMKRKYPTLYKSYFNGKGSEMKAQSGKLPKMASVASSSRFCYLALRAIKGKAVEVEKPCRIKGVTGTCPQMDAYIKADNAFIEVKCHEIFDSHKTELSKQYWKYIFGDKNDFGFKAMPEPKESTFEICMDKQFGIKTKTNRFDFKQFLCHLMGIAFPACKEDLEKNAKLVYLFFRPESDDSELKTVFDELEAEIKEIFKNKHIADFCKAHKIELYAIVQNSPVMDNLDVTGHYRIYP